MAFIPTTGLTTSLSTLTLSRSGGRGGALLVPVSLSRLEGGGEGLVGTELQRTF